MKSTAQVPIDRLSLPQAIRTVFKQFGWDAPTEFVFAVIGAEKFEHSKRSEKEYINVVRSRYGPSDREKPRRHMNAAEMAALKQDDGIQASLRKIRARRAVIDAERADLDAELKELDAAERALKR
jgi:hypothetical protein